MTLFDAIQYLVLGSLFGAGLWVIWNHPDCQPRNSVRRSPWPLRWLKKNRHYRRKSD